MLNLLHTTLLGLRYFKFVHDNNNNRYWTCFMSPFWGLDFLNLCIIIIIIIIIISGIELASRHAYGAKNFFLICATPLRRMRVGQLTVSTTNRAARHGQIFLPKFKNQNEPQCTGYRLQVMSGTHDRDGREHRRLWCATGRHCLVPVPLTHPSPAPRYPPRSRKRAPYCKKKNNTCLQPS